MGPRMITSALPKMPPEKLELLLAAVDSLKSVPNVVALVLGGSYARGLARPGSDIDIGIYYREAAPLPVSAVRAVADSLSAPGSSPVVTDLYGWGPWVNGGAWIQTPAGKIDFVYRNLDQVRQVLEEGARGVWRHDYDQQPPHGFRSVVYFAETHFSVPLHDPESEIRHLKNSVAHYPEPLKTRIVQDSLWGAEFSLWSCEGFASSADVCNAVACMTRAAHYLVHALFALNEEYFLNDKHANRILAQFSRLPSDFVARLAGILSQPGREAHELRDSLRSLEQVWAEAVRLTGGAYQPRFDMTSAATAKPAP